MKKLLATLSATLLLAGSLLSSTALAAVEEKEVWKFSEGVTTDAATQTFSMGAVEYAIRSTPIDFTAEDLDITIDLKTTFANSDQMISVYFTKELPTATPENGNGVCHTRFYLDNGRFGLNHSWLNGEALVTYAGGYVDFSADTTYTLRFRNVDGIIRLYINDQLTYDTAGDSHLKYSNAIKGLGTGYLTIGTNSSNGPFTTQILAVNGEAPLTPVALTGIEMASAPTKTTYAYGEDLDVTGGSVKLLYADGTSATVDLTADMVSGYDKNTAGEQDVTVTVGGKTTTFKVTVGAKPTAAVSGIAIKTPPTKTAYTIGEELDLTGAVITVSYADETTEERAVTAEMVSGYNKDTAGEQTITVTYEGKTATFKVTVSAPVKDSYKKDQWVIGPEQDSFEGKVNTEVVYNADGTITISGASGSKGAYFGLKDLIDLTAEDLDVTWKIRLDSFPVVAQETEANLQFILSRDLDGYNPLNTETGSGFRARIYRSFDDEFTFPEALFHNPQVEGTPEGPQMAYAGRTIDLNDPETPTFTFQIKRENAKIRFYIDGETLYTADGYDADDRVPVQISDALEREFADGAYLSLACLTKSGDPIKLTVLEVNGKQPWEGGETDQPKPMDPTGVSSSAALMLGLAAAAAVIMGITFSRRKIRG